MSYLKNSDYSNPSLDGRPQHTSIIRWVDQAYKALRANKVCFFHILSHTQKTLVAVQALNQEFLTHHNFEMIHF